MAPGSSVWTLLLFGAINSEGEIAVSEASIVLTTSLRIFFPFSPFLTKHLILAFYLMNFYSFLHNRRKIGLRLVQFFICWSLLLKFIFEELSLGASYFIGQTKGNEKRSLLGNELLGFSYCRMYISVWGAARNRYLCSAGPHVPCPKSGGVTSHICMIQPLQGGCSTKSLVGYAMRWIHLSMWVWMLVSLILNASDN